MAVPDDQALVDLFAQVETENTAVRAMLDNMLAEQPALPDLEELDNEPLEVEIRDAFQVVVECRDEHEQQTLYERLTREGFKCKLMSL